MPLPLKGWDGGQLDEARVRRPARSRMREPSGEGESCWLEFRTYQPTRFFLNSRFPFIPSRFSIPEILNTPLAGQEEQCIVLPCAVSLSLRPRSGRNRLQR